MNAVDDNGETAMHGAAYKSLPKVVQLLADKGAKIEVWNRKNKYGWTPLSIAEGHRPGNFKPSPETDRRPSSRDARRGRIAAAKRHADRGPQGLLVGRGGEARAVKHPSTWPANGAPTTRRPQARSFLKSTSRAVSS